jgi:translation initiation factor 3 subunit I
MRPLMLKGHEGPITKICYNREGDLLFTCARKDKKPVVWYSNGDRLGTFNGHQGAVWDLDCNFTSTRIMTASADMTAKLWDVQTGKELYTFTHDGSVRRVGWAEGDRMTLTLQENNHGADPVIFIFNMADDIAEQTSVPVRELVGEHGVKMTDAKWGPLNNFIISSDETGALQRWNVETGQVEQTVNAHQKKIQSLQFSKDHTMFITASSDHTAKLFDTKTMKLLKTYESDRPLNSAAIHPKFNQVIAGGGQDAMNVTVTSSKVGHFETDFFHTVYMDFMGSVKGHFGPINSVAFNPDGKSYASGSEDGYCRVHHFDSNYFNNKWNGIP